MILGNILPWKRNVFIDGGGNNGSSVRKFRKEYDPYNRFKAYSFEPNPLFTNNFSKFKNHVLIQAALYNQDGYHKFYLDREDGDGSTFYENKLTKYNGGFGTLDLEFPMDVRTIDLSQWIINELTINDYIILKLDIEGAEYDVLEKMIEDHTIERVKFLLIEWHWHKVGIKKERHENVYKIISDMKIPIKDWDAYGY